MVHIHTFNYKRLEIYEKIASVAIILYPFYPSFNF